MEITFLDLKIYISVHKAESIKKEVLKYSMSLSGKFTILIYRAFKCKVKILKFQLVHTNENCPQDRLENMVVGNPVGYTTSYVLEERVYGAGHQSGVSIHSRYEFKLYLE